MSRGTIKTREPGPEFQALASEWKPQVRRAWLVKPPPPETVAPPKLGGSAGTAAPAEVARPELAGTTALAATEMDAPGFAAPAELALPGLAVPDLAAPTASALPTASARPGLGAPKMGATVSVGPTKSAGAPALAGGWTKVPNALLETLMRCDLGPRALRVLLYLTRQTAGFHRDSVELSYVNIAAATNVGQAKLPAVLRELTTRGFIERTSGNGKKNRFSVAAVSGAATLGGPTETAAADLEGAPTANSGATTHSRTGVGTEPDNVNDFERLPPKNAELKKFSFKEISERNSLSAPPDAWQRYTATLTDKARERANSIFEGLKQRFPDDDANEIAACPDNLRKFGAPDGASWAEIKSPHGLRENAWPQLRDFFRGKREAQRHSAAAMQAREQELSALERRKAADDAALNAQADAARTAFAAAFPDEAMRVMLLEKFCPRWVSNARTEPGRSLAIDAWYRATQATTQDRENDHEQ